DQVKSSGVVGLTIKNYNGIDDFKFQNVVISTSVGTGLGALAEEINRNADKTGVRATFNVQTVGTNAIETGATSEDFAINGVTIGKVDYSDNDENGSLISAINAVKDTTGVQASKDENGKLVLTSADGRGIKITGNIGQGANIIDKENYGRLSLVKNDGRDINISGTGLAASGFASTQQISQSSVSLRESKGQINANIADAMGFNAYAGGAAKVLYLSTGTGTLNTDAEIAAYMNKEGSGYSDSSGYSIGSGKNISQSFSGVVFVGSTNFSNVYNASAGTGFSAGSNQSQFATMRTSAGNNLGVKDETAGVTTLKGAMAVMDIAETAITNLDQIRADIGSVQNQVTSTINNITVTQVNVKSAESQIRDVDFASESANYSKANILAQSGSYAMAQANSSQQNVLRLLQ
ncbi:flagellin, partial [Campylobacter coli]|nr:flagellin [Campylobacter coli]